VPTEDASAAPITEQVLIELWEEHLRYEFATRDPDQTMATMVDQPYVNHVPVLTGGVGQEQLRAFYATHFIPRMPPDLEIIPVSRTVGASSIVDEMVLRFSHTVEMDWMLPGLAPTGRAVEIPLAAIVQFRDRKVAAEHIYWDQAAVLVQLGLLDATTLPVAGAETARKVLDPSLPSNALIERANRSAG
jgi:carboxymethylenebutenolidase